MTARTDEGHAQRRPAGDRSRARVLEQAARLATVEGLDGLSIGRLASVTGMPKSSVYVLFGSKEALQLETVQAARESFMAEVVLPALDQAPPGRERLLRLGEGFLSYVRRRFFPGGCFFVAAAAELGSRSGPVHDKVAEYQDQWRELLESEARHAVSSGELPDEDPAQLAFEIQTLLAGTNLAAVLHDDDAMIDRALTALRARLGPPTDG